MTMAFFFFFSVSPSRFIPHLCLKTCLQYLTASLFPSVLFPCLLPPLHFSVSCLIPLRYSNVRSGLISFLQMRQTIQNFTFSCWKQHNEKQIHHLPSPFSLLSSVFCCCLLHSLLAAAVAADVTLRSHTRGWSGA